LKGDKDSVISLPWNERGTMLSTYAQQRMHTKNVEFVEFLVSG